MKEIQRAVGVDVTPKELDGEESGQEISEQEKHGRVEEAFRVAEDLVLDKD